MVWSVLSFLASFSGQVTRISRQVTLSSFSKVEHLSRSIASFGFKGAHHGLFSETVTMVNFGVVSSSQISFNLLALSSSIEN